VEAMLDISFEETRVYRELREEVTERAKIEEAAKQSYETSYEVLYALINLQRS
jgi:predicted transposase YdaD